MAGTYISYGNTWETVNACCAAKDAGCSTVIAINPYKHFGGPIINGLGAIDLGRFGANGIGYLTDQFRDKQNKMLGSGVSIMKTAPFIAEQVFKWLFDMHGVTVLTERTLTAANKTGAHLDSIVAGGTTFTADQFHDGIEGGNLAVMAGVTSTFGRESAAAFGESLAGFAPAENTFTPFDCFQSPGVLLPGFLNYPALSPGDADLAIMAYTYRLAITRNVEHKLDWPLPAGYDPLQFEWMIRAAPLSDPNWIPFGANSCLYGIGDMNGDFGVPNQWGYPGGNQATRDGIATYVSTTELGWLWFLANDPSVNATTQAYVRTWGPDSRCFHDSTPTPRGIPKEMYIRHSRRGTGFLKTMTQDDLQVSITKTNVLAMGFYSIDWHNAARYAVTRGGIPGFINDSLGYNPDVSLRQVTPYAQPFEMGCPNPAQVVNLTCGRMLGMTSVASGSLRIDMQSSNFSSGLGYVGGRAARDGVALSAVSIPTVQAELTARGQVLVYP